jgi:hypothetical protein
MYSLWAPSSDVTALAPVGIPAASIGDYPPGALHLCKGFYLRDHEFLRHELLIPYLHYYNIIQEFLKKQIGM